ncbi:MAG: iron complex transport system ATP-binding protein [Candidatus Magnetoglobus multicellularis str. Araruama]|uniref:Iron complex transport system ATP-binding protein n=1 Tax=Candidatus Magnetoglobus multicellularis str. Araruama TaxID=890399 RepID=A0A1V1PGS3_9BACT|nr:MAG: iron complex transport system ATP-binding protein [Candidatus Magnetoglobus multicellularis str. Araruama]
MGYILKEICFAYDQKQVFDDLTITFKKGLFYGILGPNGCGKTTLLDLLLNYHRPNKGKLLFNGQSIDTYSRQLLSQKIALVPQDFEIRFPFLVEEIVMMGRYPHLPRFARPRKVDITKVNQVLEKTGTWKLKNRMITELSKGEKQRVVFARALAQDTDMLLLDEATANLDIEHSLHLLELAKKGVTKSEKTVIAVFHDINLAAMFCDEIVLMENGNIFAMGQVNDVLTSENIKSVFHVDANIRCDTEIKTCHVIFKRIYEKDN